MVQHPRGLLEALCQKCNSDLCCCFSCFCAGPERAVHTARDGSPSPRQPDPSHREKRYIRVSRPTYSSVVCLASPSFRLRATVSLLPSASCSHASICTSVDTQTCGPSRAIIQLYKCTHELMHANSTSSVGLWLDISASKTDVVWVRTALIGPSRVLHSGFDSHYAINK